jgi:hypothetical protein
MGSLGWPVQPRLKKTEVLPAAPAGLERRVLLALYMVAPEACEIVFRIRSKETLSGSIKAFLGII